MFLVKNNAGWVKGWRVSTTVVMKQRAKNWVILFCRHENTLKYKMRLFVHIWYEFNNHQKERESLSNYLFKQSTTLFSKSFLC